MSVLFLDNTEPNDDFIMRKGDSAYVDIHVLDKATKGPRNVTAYEEIIFDIEGVVFQITKTKSSGELRHSQPDVIRVPIEVSDSDELLGLYTIQCRLINDRNEREIILRGTGCFLEEVIN